MLTPALTTKPFAVTSTPVLAVTIPTESILVTSSYVKIPPIVAAPLTFISTAESEAMVISGVPPILNAVFANPTLVPAPRVVVPETVNELNVVAPVTSRVPSKVLLAETDKFPVISPETEPALNALYATASTVLPAPTPPCNTVNVDPSVAVNSSATLFLTPSTYTSRNQVR